MDALPGIDGEIERLFRAESEALFRCACTIPEVDRTMAEDLVQMTFVAAIDDWPRLSALGPERRRQWLYAVLKNKAIDQWRRGRRLLLLEEYEEAGEPAAPDTAHRALCALALDQVWDAIIWMPKKRQKVAFLCWVEGWSTREVADWLGITQDTVRSHLKLARDHLIKVAGSATPFIDDHRADGLDGRKAGS